ncbi:MAG TPA: hypothetical protein VK468_06830, partial [Pyrinomonadaceae bacterium]|nr:hypothetical protein [Pyrinomonadaceae bacterium]
MHKKSIKTFTFVGILLMAAAGLARFGSSAANAQEEAPLSVRVGEKITYAVSFGRFNSVAYAELYSVSRG